MVHEMVDAIRVLYVDDESDLLELAKLFLEEDGEFVINTVSSGNQALELLKTERYDTIISDYQMPGMDGIAFLKQVRLKNKGIPFILFTGRGREEVAIEAFENGADSYLQKGGAPEPQFAELVNKMHTVVSRRRAEQEVIALNRLYTVLSATNKAVMQIHDKKALLNEICRIVIEIGGLKMAWAGLFNPENHSIEPTAVYDHINGYLEMIDISTLDIPLGRGLTGIVFREGKFKVCNNVEHDPIIAPWRNGTLERGYLSIAAFPFALDTKNAGVITFYALESGFFNDPIIRLLDEQSADISSALLALDQEEQRIGVENELKKSELQYRRLFETAQDAILILDGNTGEVIEANKFILDMLGYPLEEFVGKHLWELGFIKDKSTAQDAFTELKTNGYIRYEDLPLETKDGLSMDVEFISNVYLVGDKKIIQCNIRDITARKMAEKALADSERRIILSLEAADIGAWELDLITHTAWRSFRHDQIFGYEELLPEWTYEMFLDHVLPEDRSMVDTKFGQAMKNLSVWDFECRIRKKDGVIRWIWAKGQPEYNDFHEPQKMFGLVEDITDRKQTELELVSTHERLKEAHRLAHIGIWDWVIETDTVTWSKELYNIAGWDPLLPAPTFAELPRVYSPTSWESLSSAVTRALTTGEPYNLELEMIRPDGNIRWTNAFGGVQRDKTGKVIGLYGTVQDITEHKQMEEALQKSEERLRFISDNLTSGVIIVDGETHTIEFANPTASTLFMTTPDHIVGKKCHKFLCPADEGACPITDLNQKVDNAERVLLNTDGVRVPVLKSVKRIQIGGREKLLENFIDISERKRTEDALNQTNKKLNLLSGITRHDIKNKVITIQGFLRFARKAKDIGEIQPFLDKIQDSAKAIEHQIEFTKDYQNLGLKSPKWLNLSNMVILASNPAIRITDKTGTLQIFADPLFEKVLYNLIDNTVRHGEIATEIFVSFIIEQDNIRIIWADNGVGVPTDQKEMIFQRGYGKNTGFGLFMIREILAITGLTIKETGEPGKGARFEINVPNGKWQFVRK